MWEHLQSFQDYSRATCSFCPQDLGRAPPQPVRGTNGSDCVPNVDRRPCRMCFTTKRPRQRLDSDHNGTPHKRGVDSSIHGLCASSSNVPSTSAQATNNTSKKLSPFLQKLGPEGASRFTTLMKEYVSSSAVPPSLDLKMSSHWLILAIFSLKAATLTLCFAMFSFGFVAGWILPSSLRSGNTYPHRRSYSGLAHTYGESATRTIATGTVNVKGGAGQRQT